jgi:hypothetical protein
LDLNAFLTEEGEELFGIEFPPSIKHYCVDVRRVVVGDFGIVFQEEIESLRLFV